VYSLFVMDDMKSSAHSFQITLYEVSKRITLQEDKLSLYLPKTHITINIHVLQFQDIICMRGPN
jgi:hypothetical protein